eukprot:20448-Heterococcus_DN1.PRE.1
MLNGSRVVCACAVLAAPCADAVQSHLSQSSLHDKHCDIWFSALLSWSSYARCAIQLIEGVTLLVSKKLYLALVEALWFAAALSTALLCVSGCTAVAVTCSL